MADVTISQLESGKPSNSALIPYSESGVTKATTVSNFGVPIGAVFHLATSTVPTGYLKCNGDTVPNGSGTIQGVTADFSALYTSLGSTYGSAGKLPDLRGEFIRGFDDGRDIDTSRVMGSSQLDQLQGHWHSTNSGYTGSTGAPYNVPLAGNGGDTRNVDWYARTIVTNGVNSTPRTGSETRPRNVALMPVIKY
jgi:microcystin-dependent protein